MNFTPWRKKSENFWGKLCCYWKQLFHLLFLQFCIIFIIFPILQLQYLKQEQTDCFPEAFTVKLNLLFFFFNSAWKKEENGKKPLKFQHYLRDVRTSFYCLWLSIVLEMLKHKKNTLHFSHIYICLFISRKPKTYRTQCNEWLCFSDLAKKILLLHRLLCHSQHRPEEQNL